MDSGTGQNMNIKILKIDDPEWDLYFKKLPSKFQDPYFNVNYFNLQHLDGEAFCFVAEENDNLLFYPFIKIKINSLGYDLDNEYYDIQGVYGYNGPLIKSNEKQFINQSRQLFIKYCRSENIISEFMRFNPIYKNNSYFNDMEVVCSNRNVVVDLDTNIWTDSYAHSTRKNVNKAIKNGLYAKIIDSHDITDLEVEIFSNIYDSTMDRLNANKEYLFTYEYFQSFRKHLPRNSLFIFVYKENIPISAELVMYSSYIAYSFLGGTLENYFEYRPNDYLKHILIQDLKQRKIKYFCLGGGIEFDDGIYNYKKKFAKDGIYDFYIGKSIFNQKVYDLIVKQWKQKTSAVGQEKYKHYLCRNWTITYNSS